MSVFERFLNTEGDSGAYFKLVDKTNPLNWSNLGKTVAASIIGGFIIGVQTVVNASTGATASLLQDATRWLTRTREFFRYPGGKEKLWGDGLIATIETGILDVINAAWAPLTGLGWIAYPVAVAEVVVSLYIVAWAVSYVQEEVL